MGRWCSDPDCDYVPGGPPCACGLAGAVAVDVGALIVAGVLVGVLVGLLVGVTSRGLVLG